MLHLHLWSSNWHMTLVCFGSEYSCIRRGPRPPQRRNHKPNNAPGGVEVSTCTYRFKSGKRKGEVCGEESVDADRCVKHIGKDLPVTPPVAPAKPEVLQDEVRIKAQNMPLHDSSGDAVANPAASDLDESPFIEDPSRLRLAGELADELKITLDQVLTYGQIEGGGDRTTPVDPGIVRLNYELATSFVVEETERTAVLVPTEDIVRKATVTSNYRRATGRDRARLRELMNVIAAFWQYTLGPAESRPVFRPELRDYSRDGKVVGKEYDNPLMQGHVTRVNINAHVKLAVNPSLSYPLIDPLLLRKLEEMLANLSFVPIHCNACVHRQLDQVLPKKVELLLNGRYHLRDQRGRTLNLLKGYGRDTKDVKEILFRVNCPECNPLVGRLKQIVLVDMEGADFSDEAVQTDFLKRALAAVKDAYGELKTNPAYRGRVTLEGMRDRMIDITDDLLKKGGS